MAKLSSLQECPQDQGTNKKDKREQKWATRAPERSSQTIKERDEM